MQKVGDSDIVANFHSDRLIDFNFRPRMNRIRSRGARGRSTSNHGVRSSRSPFHSTSSTPNASVWQPQGSPLEHDAESLPSYRGRETKADGIAEQVASVPPLNIPNKHDDSPRSTYSHVGTPMQVTPDHNIGKPSSLSDSGSQQNNLLSSCLNVNECSPLASSVAEHESNSIDVIDSLVPRGRSSRPSGHSTNRSAPGANCWRRHGESPLIHNTTTYSCERPGKETLPDSISGRFACMTLLDNPHMHDVSPQSISSQAGTPKQVKPYRGIDQPFSASSSGSRHMDSPLSCLSGKLPSPDHTSNVIFDICQKNDPNTFKLQPSLLEKNREKRKETKHSMEAQNIKILGDGILLLKSFIPLMDQVRIVKTCQELGIGSGGFYQPGYRDGAKLSLRMMCLGKHWDPETSNYSDQRPFDGAKPPVVPDEFCDLVKNALCQTRSYLEKQLKYRDIDTVLPLMSPDICIVNFYTDSGRLGLHQDKDESQKSLDRGLPVVSFSIGDTAEFLYSSEKDIDRANNVLLESGDVLIFGGKSRLIYHGVSSIKPGTASKNLSAKTNLKPGRLNLTLRQY